MKLLSLLCRAVATTLLIGMCCQPLLAQPFTYQGMLKEKGVPADGAYDFIFRLYATSTGGLPLGTLRFDDLKVVNGLFTVTLDFGAAWDGSNRYLQIEVRPGDSTGSYTVLSPRVRVNYAPYSVFSLGAVSAARVPWEGISGMPAGFADGIDNDTLYSAGAGLQLTGTEFSIAPGGVVTSMIADGAVTTAKIGDGQVTSGKIADFSITSDKIVNAAVTMGKIAPGAVTTAHLAAGAVTPDRINASGASAGQALMFDGSNVIWGNPTATLSLPFAGSMAYSGYLLSITNTGTGQAIRAQSNNHDGLEASSSAAYRSGLYAFNNNENGYGVYGANWNTGTIGILGHPASGVHGESALRGVYGWATATSGYANGVYGRSDSTDGRGVLGWATANSGATYGVYGRSDSTDGAGVYGWATATSGDTFGVWGVSESSSGAGVFGHAHADSGRTYGVYGMSSSPEGVGVLGIAGSGGQSGESYGALAVTYSTAGTGVAGYANALTGTTYGVFGKNYSTSGTGVYGWASATSGNTYGVFGISDSTSGRGLHGWASATSGTNYGVYGGSNSPTGYGVYSYGRFAATGTKSFQIDHPLNPENAYLSHYSAEGPEPYNIYRGTVVLDARGEAWVQLPDYFESINRDPSYHLTAVGAPMPNLHVAVEIRGNRFKIAGGAPGKKVSWRVEAIRNDRWVQEYGYQTEQPKPAEHRGKYLNPELYGQPKELGIHYRPEPERVRR